MNITAEVPGAALTTLRYPLGRRLAKRLRNEEPIRFDMAVMAAADLLDGVILRKFERDTPARRVADGVVDHAVAAEASIEAYKKYSDVRPYLVLFAARAAIVGVANTAHFIKTGEVTKGENYQRIFNISLALLLTTATEENKVATHAVGLAGAALTLGTVPKFFEGLGRSHQDGIRKLQ